MPERLNFRLAEPTENDLPNQKAAANGIRDGPSQCLDTSEDGRPILTVTLPDVSALDQLAETLAQLVPKSQPNGHLVEP